MRRESDDLPGGESCRALFFTEKSSARNSAAIA
uniref:Uncharacterized protein n=1 Tax=Siphoviridae sp. ctVJE9 TaxID=2825530 RepID=A0A8S5TUL1_9CAUD|nr:MAG TPA: hypothetical protein [Siphoviridae sp. ctVJE9]